MTTDRTRFIVGMAALAFAISCHEVVGPTADLLQQNPRVSLVAGPPSPVTYALSSIAFSSVELTSNNYPYNTWIEIVPDGSTISLTAIPPAQPSSGLVYATGAAGGRNGCDLNAVIAFWEDYYSFGTCGSPEHADTLLVKQQGFLRRGSWPLDYTAPDNPDCPAPNTTCHTVEIKDTHFTVRPIPVTMRQVTASPRTVRFDSVDYKLVTFTTGPSPDTLTIGGVLNGNPFTTTSWVYTAGDGTLDGNMCSGGFPIRTCQPYLHKAGRMVVKAFTGGWEQTSSVTVQCLMNPSDDVLNDTTNDFQSRAALLTALDHANPDSLPGVGYDPNKGRGWRHETGGTVWQLPTGGGFLFVEEDDPNATECTYHYTAEPTPPVPGAVKHGNFHVHSYTQNDPLYGCDSVKTKRGYVKARKYPGDPNAHYTPTAGIDDFHGGGSDEDWQFVQRKEKPNYVINKWGNAYVLSYHGSNLPIYPNPKRYFARGNFAGKCTWVPSL